MFTKHYRDRLDREAEGKMNRLPNLLRQNPICSGDTKSVAVCILPPPTQFDQQRDDGDKADTNAEGDLGDDEFRRAALKKSKSAPATNAM
ncbi:MAG: hypothetical protein R2873_19685 [Caldilineaceae bacterium]